VECCEQDELYAVTCMYMSMFTCTGHLHLRCFDYCTVSLLQHMVKYRYLPFSYGKRRYKGKEETTPSQ